MKFHILNGLTTLAGFILVSTLGEPLLTDAVRMPLQVVVVLFSLITVVLERMLRPKEGASSGALVRNVMGATLIKMMIVLTGILMYIVAEFPDPKNFAIATYLLYAAFTAILVAESMRHSVPPTDGV
ncbi:MAG: hypothetical protein ISP55_01240 [Flavobacteriales bacterium]|nr:hypothetical protein [Flavobacteriales bacterium]